MGWDNYCANKNNYQRMRQTPHIRKKISFTPIMLTSKSIRPVDRGDYETSRNQLRINKIKKNRNDLSNLILREKSEVEYSKAFCQNQQHNHFSQTCFDDAEEQSYRKLVRKMTTPTVVKVQFQKELIKNRKKAEMRLKQYKQQEISEQLKSDLTKAFYFTNAKTFQQFTKMNKIKSNKMAHQDSTDEQWKTYLNKYYLSIRKVRPLMKKDQGMRLLSPQKIGLISNMQHVHHQGSQSNQILSKIKLPFRSHSKREYRHAHTQKRDISQSPEKKELPQQMINSIIFKKIEQDISLHRSQNKKDFFVFGLSQNNCKSGDGPQLKQKLQNLWDFIYRINFTNGLYVCTRDEQKPVRFYVGFGNNSALIKGIIRRRFWWTITEKIQEAHFVWTQLKVSDLFKNQRKNALKYKVAIKSKRNYHSHEKGQDAQAANRAIMAGTDLKIWERYYQNNLKCEEKGFPSSLTKRANGLLKYKKIDVLDSNSKTKIHNHLQCNYFLGNKKALFYSMKKYYQLKGIDPFTKIPLTFHITQGLEDPQFQTFLNVFQNYNERRKNQKDLKNIWIVKPGELTNQGRGITVCSTLDEIKVRLKSKQKNGNGTSRTFIIQKYIEKPLLYQKRKFDIRHYMAITCTNGRIKGYWYADGYIRTTSSQYSTKNTKDLFTHLTNDAVQKGGQDYGKFQKGNKISYHDFKKYLNHATNHEVNFYQHILPKMKEIATDTIRATYGRLDPERRQHNFELFGLDFMLDENLNVYLIEVNTNPNLEQSCPLLTKILIPLVDNLFKICIDPLFPPPVEWPPQRKYFLGDNALQQNKFALVFDQCQQDQQLRDLYKDQQKLDDRMGDIFEQEQQYNDQQKEWNEDEEKEAGKK